MPVLGSASSAAPAGGKPGQTVVRRGTTDLGWGQLTQRGIIVPDGWGSYARAAAASAKAGTGKFVINCAGDSLTLGASASHIRNTSWAGLLRSYVQTATADGGDGFAHANTGSYPTANGGWSLNGAWTTTYPSVDYGGGPAGMIVYCSPNAGSTPTATSPPLRGRYVTLYYGTFGTDESTTGHQSVAWTIDGVAQTAINTQRTDTTGRKVGSVTVDTGSAGPHTVVVSVVGSSSQKYLELFGAAAENATGAIVNQFGKAGGKSGSLARIGNAQDFENPALWSGGASYPGDLHIYAMGVNCVNNATFTSAQQFTRDVQAHLDYVMAGKSGQTDLMIVMPHVGTWDSGPAAPGAGGSPPNDGYAALVVAARGLADTYGAAFVNLWALGRNSWAWMNAQGYWGNTGLLTGVTGTDGVHLSNTGHAWWFNQLSPLIDTVLAPAV